MFLLGMRDLVATMLALLDRIELVQGVRWPLHQALREAAAEATDRGLTGLPTMEFRPDPDVGWRVEGVDAVLDDLRWEGVLSTTGDGMSARLLIGHGDAAARRALLRLQPDTADVVYRAARRWAALAATSSKNWATAVASPGATVASCTPALLHPSAPALR
jgi:hypothetical protein